MPGLVPKVVATPCLIKLCYENRRFVTYNGVKKRLLLKRSKITTTQLHDHMGS